MQNNNKKLGRGISALLGDSKSNNHILTPNQEKKLIENISMNRIIAGIYQPRRSFDENELQELAESIKQNGVIQPIILRKIGDENMFEIIAGERRFRASKIAGLNEIPAIVKKINNHEALELALIENIQRSDLSLIEEAYGYQRLIEEFSYTQDQIGKRVNKSRAHIANILRLLSLPNSVQKMLDEKLISMGHARAIINSNNPEMLAKKIVAESLTVRDIEDFVREEKIVKISNNKTSSKTSGESSIKLKNEIKELENVLNQISDMETKISYNVNKNNGKITIKFNDILEVEKLISRLKNN